RYQRIPSSGNRKIPKPPVHVIGLHEQMAMMTRQQPGFECVIERLESGTLLVCRGDIQPTALNAKYIVRVEYQIPRRPKVWVEVPELQQRHPEERIPHTYRDGDLCLYYAEFKSDQYLARTIIPWASLWLMYYEA